MNTDTIDSIVKQAVIELLVKVTCLDCIQNIEAIRPPIEKVILDAFFRCGDIRANNFSRDLAAARLENEALKECAAYWRKQAENTELKEPEEKQDKSELTTARWKLRDIQRDMEVVRDRMIEEIAQFIENEPIHSWVPGILAERIRALTKSRK